MERLLQKIPQGCAGLGKVVGLYRENTSEVPGSGCWIEFWSGPWLRGFRVSASHKVGRHRSMTRPALERSVVQTSGVTSVLVEEMFFFSPLAKVDKSCRDSFVGDHLFSFSCLSLAK